MANMKSTFKRTNIVINNTTPLPRPKVERLSEVPDYQPSAMAGMKRTFHTINYTTPLPRPKVERLSEVPDDYQPAIMAGMKRTFSAIDYPTPPPPPAKRGELAEPEKGEEEDDDGADDDYDSDSEDWDEEEEFPRARSLRPLHTSVSTTAAPLPVLDYHEQIYQSTTLNPLLPLAIYHIAAKNLPYLDFTISAINHLPIALDDPYPSWPSAGKLSTIPYLNNYPRSAAPQMRPCLIPCKAMPKAVTVLFLPHFYADKRHAVGWYLLASNNGIPTDKLEMFFTPCSTYDLQDLQMIRMLGSHAMGDKDEERLDVLLSIADRKYAGIEVGGGGGKWLDPEARTRAARREWCTARAVVGGVWQWRFGGSGGGGRGGGWTGPAGLA
jgi:hypothetical protein